MLICNNNCNDQASQQYVHMYVYARSIWPIYSTLVASLLLLRTPSPAPIWHFHFQFHESANNALMYMYVCMYRYCPGYIDFDISQIYIYNLWCLHLRHLIATGLGLGIVFFFRAVWVYKYIFGGAKPELWESVPNTYLNYSKYLSLFNFPFFLELSI